MDASTTTTTRFDVVLVGGGLANGLIALALLQRDPGASIALVERASGLGGNHTWCLHPQDMPEAAAPWLSPILNHRWAGYDVRFPGLERGLDGEYAALTSDGLDRAVRWAMEDAPHGRLFLDSVATRVTANAVELSDGRVLCGRAVLDGRGPERAAHAGAGFQKFIGLELAFTAPHGLTRPVLMDATVPQLGGFRFFYVLPLAADRLLVEDTRFSRSAHLDQASLEREVLAYAARFGPVASIVRRERGVLPMPFRAPRGGLPKTGAIPVGYGGGFFHPATGYSFPVALRVACHLAECGANAIDNGSLAALRAEHERAARYARRLNWLLFHCFEDDRMWHVFERFYRLPEPLIHRFYAMTMTRSDQVRILAGQPPKGLSLRAAVRHATSPNNPMPMAPGGAR